MSKWLLVKPPVRKWDTHGNGAWQAARGKRLHNGIDYACMPDSEVLAVTSGTVTKLGFPYSLDDPKKKHLRYVQITDPADFAVRYFYVLPTVTVGDEILEGTPIGLSQSLDSVYPGITPHVHLEVKDPSGTFVNPETYLRQAQ
jgi:murein DD-endopeptidase MepM/ murein hydrolase activator NlpD